MIINDYLRHSLHLSHFVMDAIFGKVSARLANRFFLSFFNNDLVALFLVARRVTLMVAFAILPQHLGGC